MRISEMIGSWLSSRRRLQDRLEAIAVQVETLAANLARHAEMCDFPTLKAGLERLAGDEAVSAKAFREMLLNLGLSPKLPENEPYDGSSNWARLNHDLAAQVEILRALHSQVPEWTGIDAAMAERLRQLALQEEEQIGQLRDLTLKCDPQALD